MSSPEQEQKLSPDKHKVKVKEQKGASKKHKQGEEQDTIDEHKETEQKGVPKKKKDKKQPMSGNVEQDPTDQHQQVPVQLPAAKLDEIKKQWDEVKKLIKENRPRVPDSPISWRAVVLMVIIAVVGWLVYAAYDDLAMRQRKIVVAQNKLVNSLDKLSREVEKEMKELKSQLVDIMKSSSADEVKLLRSIESSSRRLEEKLKAQPRGKP